MSKKVDHTFSYQCCRILFKPYRFVWAGGTCWGGVIGKYLGGCNKYVSPLGKYDWQNDCLKSLAFTLDLFWTAMVMSRSSSSWERNGAKTLLLDQLVGSRLPRTPIWYLYHWGLSFVFVLMVAKDIVGRALPTDVLSCWFFLQDLGPGFCLFMKTILFFFIGHVPYGFDVDG